MLHLVLQQGMILFSTLQVQIAQGLVSCTFQNRTINTYSLWSWLLLTVTVC